MSADNYLYVRKMRSGKWTVTMEFASDSARPAGKRGKRYATWAEAYKAAQKWQSEGPYPIEYGICSDPAEIPTS